MMWWSAAVRCACFSPSTLPTTTLVSWCCRLYRQLCWIARRSRPMLLLLRLSAGASRSRRTARPTVLPMILPMAASAAELYFKLHCQLYCTCCDAFFFVVSCRRRLVLLLPRLNASASRSRSVPVHRLLRPRGASRRKPHAHKQRRRHAGSSRYVRRYSIIHVVRLG